MPRTRRDGIEIDPEKVTYFRNLRALSRVRLSARSGIPYRVLTYYEDGRRKPRADNFRKLYTALGCGPEDLLKARYKKQHLRDRSVID
jgi:transcriptional regulator with XRE-family HTH domain